MTSGNLRLLYSNYDVKQAGTFRTDASSSCFSIQQLYLPMISRSGMDTVSLSQRVIHVQYRSDAKYNERALRTRLRVHQNAFAHSPKRVCAFTKTRLRVQGRVQQNAFERSKRTGSHDVISERAQRDMRPPNC